MQTRPCGQYARTLRGVETSGPLWNATAFTGAVLPFADLVDATDQRAAALEFFRARRTP